MLFVVARTDPIAAMRRRLKAAGLDRVVAPVAARVDARSGDGDDYVLAALVPIGPAEKDRIAAVMGETRYVINTRRFSDGCWSETR